MHTSHDIMRIAMVTEEFTPLCYDLSYVNRTAITYKRFDLGLQLQGGTGMRPMVHNVPAEFNSPVHATTRVDSYTMFLGSPFCDMHGRSDLKSMPEHT